MRFLRFAVLLAITLLCSAHVGSPDAWYEGPAGPYHVLVHVEAPGVIPGIAVVNVRVTGDGVARVTAVANKFDATGGAPPPEVASPVDGEAGWYRTRLWIMTSGSNSITVGVTGQAGTGSAIVPLVAVPSRRLEFDRRLGAGLGVLGVILFIGLLTIVGAAVREGVLPPGVEPDARRARYAWIARGATTLVISLLLFGGWKWWNAEDSAFVRSMFKPMSSDASIAETPDGRTLVLAISDSSWIMRNDAYWMYSYGLTRRSPLIADHGKLMHLFAASEDGSAFAHLHPTTADSTRFVVPLPPLPAGRYRVFGDIVHESGLAQTLVSSVEIPQAIVQRTAGGTSDPDDAWAVRDPPGSANEAVLDDGSRMLWLRTDAPLVAGGDASLRFVIMAPGGAPAVLEPYMGMPAHAVVVRDDGRVFIHLHPQGTISMAAQMSFMMREPGDTVSGRLGRRLAVGMPVAEGSHASMDVRDPPASPGKPAMSDTLSFPYAFPEAGTYHIWVQAKRQGRVLTGSFVARVEPRR